MQHVRELLGGFAFSGFVAFFDAKQHSSGPKAYQCALYREMKGESIVGEEGGSRHKGRNPGTILPCVGCYSLIRKKSSSQNFVDVRMKVVV